MSLRASRRQLAGFGELLDWQPLEFADAVPKVFCCTLCGVLPTFTKRLTPCCHVFCRQCFEMLAEREHRCPLDQTPFADEAVDTLDSVHGGVNRLRARCPNASSGCTFVGALPELKEHVAGRCDHNAVQCPRCGAAVLHSVMLYHHLEDCGGARKSTLAEDEAAERPQIVAAIRSLLEGSHGGFARPVSRSASRTPPMEASAVKRRRKSVTASKTDLQGLKSTTEDVSKRAGGVQEVAKALTEERRIDGKAETFLFILCFALCFIRMIGLCLYLAG
ncbi:uncharacterized protein [Dermacentor andersoni]|uniref:uncharacterized protein n=1 Tax=Dermacentor andersoni TaxID=34620 RepID=UPI0024180488|nr:RING finger protein 151-like [Dermacentor andersoni]